MTRSLRPEDLHAACAKPLRLAAEGGVFVGARRVQRPNGTFAAGQAYVSYAIPEDLRCPWPIVMIHGGGGQSTDFITTPDGRPGWRQYFLQQGYAVYLMDRPGLGRAPFHPDLLGPMTDAMPYEVAQQMFTAPEVAGKWPQAARHSQWPGSGAGDDPTLDQFVASSGPSMASLADAQLAAQETGLALLDAIGPAILLTHSAAGPCGWLIADASPGLVKGLIAVEPLGPPFSERPAGDLAWGLTAAPLRYDPPVASGDDLVRAQRPAPRPDTASCWVQAEPVRKLPNLTGFPIVVVTAEASWMAQDNHGIVDYLVQAGADATHMRLEDHGVFGNGHAVMLEKNSDEVAGLLHRWITERGLNA